jgi:hypothetical protein
MAERYRVTATVQSQNRVSLGTDPKEALRIPLFYHVAAGMYTKIAANFIDRHRAHHHRKPILKTAVGTVALQ